MMAVPGLELFVASTPGIEAITAEEVRALGWVPGETEPGGFAVEAGPDALIGLNRGLRTASRVLVRLARFKASGFAELERKAQDIPWDRVLGRHLPASPEAVRFEVTSRKSRLYHTGGIEERLRRSLDGWAGNRRLPPWPSEIPEPRFVVRLVRDRVTVSADASGEPLHRRGYRQAVGKAPLRETLAAALLLASAWDRRTPLFDPFCGSGTLVTEAALLAGGLAPGRGRRFSYEAWPGMDGPGETAPSEPAAAPRAPLVGSDRDAGAVEAARANAGRAGVAEWTSFHQAALSAAPFPTLADEGGLLVSNPPYGHRVGDPERLRNLYGRLGTLLRERWSGGRVVLLSADPALTGQLGLETRTLFKTRNGGLAVEAVAAEVP
ncbi:MAG TPA: hypothetical protein VK858_04050 [Longimicrobiales bacterium]|nr:hypothetical protein [Longimicrobiales bacterium]